MDDHSFSSGQVSNSKKDEQIETNETGDLSSERVSSDTKGSRAEWDQ